MMVTKREPRALLYYFFLALILERDEKNRLKSIDVDEDGAERGKKHAGAYMYIRRSRPRNAETEPRKNEIDASAWTTPIRSHFACFFFPFLLQLLLQCLFLPLLSIKIVT